MKTQEEIEKSARIYENYRSDSSELAQAESGGLYHGYKKGYNDCQKDMADYIFEVARHFHRLGKYSGTISDTHFTDIYEETINSLNKQIRDENN